MSPSLPATQILNAAAAVPRRRRAALVAAAHRCRRAHLISDDVVWLATPRARYCTVTGDATILNEQLPFIEGQALGPGEHDAFFTPETSKKKRRSTNIAPVRSTSPSSARANGPAADPRRRLERRHEPCRRIRARATSVWLGWFLLRTLGDFAPSPRPRAIPSAPTPGQSMPTALKRALGKRRLGWRMVPARQLRRRHAARLAQLARVQDRLDRAVLERAFGRGRSCPLDDGDGAVRKAARRRRAEDHQAVHAAFSETDKDPGYIKAYPPGVRENGGQYTHAATWFVIALGGNGAGR
jgi:cyclic beta-1,2-glucan synthetase